MNKAEILPQILIEGMESKFFARTGATPEDAKAIATTAKEWATELGIVDELRFGYIQRFGHRHEVLVIGRHKGAVARLTADGAVWLE